MPSHYDTIEARKNSPRMPGMSKARQGERTRTASRAKGIAKRQTKVAKARRAKKALGN